MGRVKAKVKNNCDIAEFSGLDCEIVDCKELNEDREEYKYSIEVEKDGKKRRGIVREYDLEFK